MNLSAGTSRTETPGILAVLRLFGGGGDGGGDGGGKSERWVVGCGRRYWSSEFGSKSASWSAKTSTREQPNHMIVH